jgi:hypothetical protein
VPALSIYQPGILKKFISRLIQQIAGKENGVNNTKIANAAPELYSK